MPITSFNRASGATGGKRTQELARENRAVVADLTAGLIKSLDRPATPAEEILAELIAATIARSRRLRDRGANDSLERAQLAALVVGSPWYARPVPSESATA